MKTWKEAFNVSLFISLFCITVVIFSPGVLFGSNTNFIILALSVLSYTFLFIMGIWVNRIVAKKDQEIKILVRENIIVSDLLTKPSLGPVHTCSLLMSLICQTGERWWNDFGKKALSKLFHGRQSNDAEKIDYIQEFLIEATSKIYQEKTSIMLPTIFSILTTEELAKVMANAYYFYAVNLTKGNVTTSAENLTLAIQNNHEVLGIVDGILLKVPEYVKEIMAEKYTGDKEQKVLGIIEGEITKAKN